jgi:hypothetical protein
MLVVCATGCTTQEINPADNLSSGQKLQTGNVVDENLSGLWNGTTSTGGMFGMAGNTRSIKLNLQQVGNKLTGTYSCYPANSSCRNGDDQGSIEGTTNGNQVNLNIMVLPDASDCRYTGILNYNGNGQYTCYSQGQIVEHGTWEAAR